ncbi:MAG: Hsp20/alpha crystallin family protein [Draconibacterium sp.]|nr:Hsp20/alpha crystallin family protein [Draconibacterium sp.]
MNLVRFNNPHYNVNRVLVDELFNNFFKNDYHEDYAKNCGTKPASNIFETETEFKIEVLLPGFKKEDVQLNYQNNLLTIKVENEVKEDKPEEYKYAHREFGAFNFEKQYRVPKSVNDEKISANFENGVLNITLLKKEEALEKAPVEIKIS